MTTRNAGTKSIAGWGEYVAPLREKSLFWHNMWSDCGRPHSGMVADIMRRTRAAITMPLGRLGETKMILLKGGLLKQCLRIIRGTCMKRKN